MCDDGLINLSSCEKADIQTFSGHLFSTIKDSLTILNINLRSANTNFTSLCGFLSQLKIVVKVIIITETHTDDSTSKLYNLNGYRKMHISRNSYGGGLMAFVHSSLEFKIDTRFSGVTETHETLFFKLICSGVINTSINFLCTYVPHRRYIHDFIKYLETFPKGIFRKNSVIVGDLNCCSRRDNNSREFKALEIFAKTKTLASLFSTPHISLTK